MNVFGALSKCNRAQCMSPHCFYVLILQCELSVLGSDLVSLLVHHFLEFLHHLPLPLRHTCDHREQAVRREYTQAKTSRQI